MDIQGYTLAVNGTARVLRSLIMRALQCWRSTGSRLEWCLNLGEGGANMSHALHDSKTKRNGRYACVTPGIRPQARCHRCIGKQRSPVETSLDDWIIQLFIATSPHPCDTPSHLHSAGPYFLVGVPLGTQPLPPPSHWLLELHGWDHRSQQQQQIALDVAHGAPWSSQEDPAS